MKHSNHFILKFILSLFFIVSFLSCVPKKIKPHYDSRESFQEDVYSNDYRVEKKTQNYSHSKEFELDTYISISNLKPELITKSNHLNKIIRYKQIPKLKLGKKYLYKQLQKRDKNNDTGTSGFILLLFALLFLGLAYLFYYVIGTILGIILGIIFAIASGVYLLGAFLALLRSIF